VGGGASRAFFKLIRVCVARSFLWKRKAFCQGVTGRSGQSGCQPDQVRHHRAAHAVSGPTGMQGATRQAFGASELKRLVTDNVIAWPRSLP